MTLIQDYPTIIADEHEQGLPLFKEWLSTFLIPDSNTIVPDDLPDAIRNNLDDPERLFDWQSEWWLTPDALIGMSQLLDAHGNTYSQYAIPLPEIAHYLAGKAILERRSTEHQQ